MVDGFVGWFSLDENLSRLLNLVLFLANSFLLLLNLLECVSVRPILHESSSLALSHELNDREK